MNHAANEVLVSGILKGGLGIATPMKISGREREIRRAVAQMEVDDFGAEKRRQMDVH